MAGRQRRVGYQKVARAVEVEPERAAAGRRRGDRRARRAVAADHEGVDRARASLIDDQHPRIGGELDLPRRHRSGAERLHRARDRAQPAQAEPEPGDRLRAGVEHVDQVVTGNGDAVRVGAAGAGRADQAQAPRGDGEGRDRIAADVDVHHHAAVARDDDRMPGAQRPAVTAGGIGACRGQRPIAGAGVRLDRVAAGRVGHGVHCARGTGAVGGPGRAREGRQRVGRGQADGTCRCRADQ